MASPAVSHERGRVRDIAMIGGNEPPRTGQVPSPPGPAAPLITAMQVFLDRLDSDVVDFEPAAEQLAAIDGWSRPAGWSSPGAVAGR
jgi:hypothetical protein